jgi:nitrogen fixation/metabolism regulation signal transduction histidine kinase
LSIALVIGVTLRCGAIIVSDLRCAPKFRLMLMLALMALVPGVLIYAVSVQFMTQHRKLV